MQRLWQTSGAPLAKRFKGTDGKRSGFENEVAAALMTTGRVEYESTKYEYIIPARAAYYLADFTVTTKRGQEIVIEAKGRFSAADRKKMLLVREAHPDIDLRLLFQQDNWLTKKKKSRYSDWARKNGFKYSIWPELPL